MGVYNRKIVSESAIYLIEMLNHVDMNSLEEKYAKNWIGWFLHIIGREFDSNLILRLYYFEKNYHDKPQSTVESLISIMCAIRALEHGNSGFGKDTTNYNYFRKYLPIFRKGLESILKDERENHTNELFLLLNTIDTLSSMQTSAFKGELDKFIEILTDIEPLFDYSFNIAPGLIVYATELVLRLGLPITLKEISPDISGKTCAFFALMKLENNEPPENTIIENAKTPRSLHLWWIAKVWNELISGETIIGILPFYQHMDVDVIFDFVFGDINEIYKISITTEEMEKVLDFDDKTIRKQLYDYFIDHPKITTFSKTRLNSERDKAHGGGEISDFNVQLNIVDEKMWIAMPVKSGRESKSTKREKMEQKYFYQFVRPLFSLGMIKTVVFPIILIKPTLNTNEFISSVRAHLDLPILVLDIEFYTKFLKKYSLI